MFITNKKERVNRVQSSSLINETTKEEIQQLLLKHNMIKNTIKTNIDNANFENYWVI
jgi:hypothetical protein